MIRFKEILIICNPFGRGLLFAFFSKKSFVETKSKKKAFTFLTNEILINFECNKLAKFFPKLTANTVLASEKSARPSTRPALIETE